MYCIIRFQRKESVSVRQYRGEPCPAQKKGIICAKTVLKIQELTWKCRES